MDLTSPSSVSDGPSQKPDKTRDKQVDLGFMRHVAEDDLRLFTRLVGMAHAIPLRYVGLDDTAGVAPGSVMGDEEFKAYWLRTRKPYLDANEGKCLVPMSGNGVFRFCEQPAVSDGMCSEHAPPMDGAVAVSIDAEVAGTPADASTKVGHETRRVLVLESYCDDECRSDCSDALPCRDCIGLCDTATATGEFVSDVGCFDHQRMFEYDRIRDEAKQKDAKQDGA